MNNNELNNFYREFSLRIDGYIEAGDIDNLKSTDQLCDQYILEYPQIAYGFWYCKANVASALLQLEDLKVDLQNTDSKVKQAPTIQIDPSWKPLIYLRQAIQHDSFRKCPSRFKAMILTNTGNALCDARRFIEAIEYYDRATAYIPLFSVALYSRGKTFYQLANWMALNPEIKVDPTAIYFLYVEAKNNFDQAFQKGAIWETHPDNIDLFSSNEAELTFSDNTEKLYKSNFAFNLETALMKSSFSKAYGIFDKIAEFIFAFWQLEVKKKNGEINKDPVISISNVWYNNLEIRRGFNTNLVNENNWFLKGLYHLSYDIVGKEIPREYILPEFKQLHEIRNKLEHSGVMITENEHAISSRRLMTISREEFIKHNISLLRLVRNALFYLSMAVGLDQYNFKNKK